MKVISFARGVPAAECLPAAELADCARTVIEADGLAVLNYGHIAGYGPLREWIGERHGVQPGRVLITNGSLQGLHLLLSHFGARGRVFVDAPTYDRPLKILAQLGADVRAIPQDEVGLDVDALEQELRRDSSPAFLYALPTFQNPTGRTLPIQRRRRLVELTGVYPLTVLEDDPYGLVRYEGEALPTLFELDGSQRILYSSSFSKVVAPGARVGYFVLQPELMASMEIVATNVYLTPGLLAQATVYEFLRRGSLEPNIERVRRLLGMRRDAMLEALAREFPTSVSWNRPDGGYFLWLEFPHGVDAGELLRQSEADGVSFVKGSDFYLDGLGGHGSARLAFSLASPAEIHEGIGRLAVLVANLARVGQAEQ